MNRLGHYLKFTHNKRLILSPSFETYFVGAYGHESNTDQACAKSHTSFVIIVAYCLVFGQSKLQPKTALSTAETKIIALAHSCR